MTIPSTNSAGSSAYDSTTSASALPTKTLNQDDFLKLLVAQMTAQDPMNPQSNADFAAQMAQFSALEQSRSMQTDMAQMRNDQQVLQANGLLGRTVTLQSDAQTSISGTVDAVQMTGGTPFIVVNGQAYDLSQLRSIQPAPITN